MWKLCVFYVFMATKEVNVSSEGGSKSKCENCFMYLHQLKR